MSFLDCERELKTQIGFDILHLITTTFPTDMYDKFLDIILENDMISLAHYNYLATIIGDFVPKSLFLKCTQSELEEFIRNNDYKIDKYSDDDEYIARNPNLTPEYLQDVLNISLDVIYAFSKNIHIDFILSNERYLFIRSAKMKRKNRIYGITSGISECTNSFRSSIISNINSRIPISVIEEYLDREFLTFNWDFFYISRNPSVTIDFVKNHIDEKWDWASLSSNPGIKMEDIDNNNSFKWSFTSVCSNPNLKIWFVQKYKDKINFVHLFRSCNLDIINNFYLKEKSILNKKGICFGCNYNYKVCPDFMFNNPELSSKDFTHPNSIYNTSFTIEELKKHIGNKLEKLMNEEQFKGDDVKHTKFDYVITDLIHQNIYNKELELRLKEYHKKKFNEVLYHPDNIHILKKIGMFTDETKEWLDM